MYVCLWLYVQLQYTYRWVCQYVSCGCVQYRMNVVCLIPKQPHKNLTWSIITAVLMGLYAYKGITHYTRLCATNYLYMYMCSMHIQTQVYFDF